MGNFNWEGATRGLSEVIGNMAKLEQQKADMMYKTMQQQQKGEDDWFSQKRKMDYQQKLKSEARINDPFAQSVTEQTRISTEKWERDKAEAKALRDFVKETIVNSKMKTWDEQKGKFEEKGFPERINFTDPDIKEAIKERFGDDLSKKAGELNMDLDAYLGFANRGMRAVGKFMGVNFEEKSTEKYIDETKVDMKSVKFLVPQLKTQEAVQEFVDNWESQGMDRNTYRYILKQVNKKGKK